jgi:hypothetical protein
MMCTMPNVRNIVVHTVVVGLVASVSLPAMAEDSEEEEEGPVVVGDTEVGIFAERTPYVERALVSPMLRLGMRVRPEVELSIKAGAFGLFQNAAQSGFQAEARPSNTVFETTFLKEGWTSGRWFQFRAGFLFALPTAFSRGELDDEIYDLVLANRGGWNAWEWDPHAMGIMIPVGLRGQVLQRIEIGAEAAGGGLFASGASNDLPALVGQGAVDVRYALPWFGVGARAQAVWNGGRAHSRSQYAVVPSLDTSFCRAGTGRRVRGLVSRTSPDCPVFASARMVVNLDRHYGFIGDDGMRVWGLLVGLGWAL